MIDPGLMYSSNTVSVENHRHRSMLLQQPSRYHNALFRNLRPQKNNNNSDSCFLLFFHGGFRSSKIAVWRQLKVDDCQLMLLNSMDRYAEPNTLMLAQLPCLFRRQLKANRLTLMQRQCYL